MSELRVRKMSRIIVRGLRMTCIKSTNAMNQVTISPLTRLSQVRHVEAGTTPTIAPGWLAHLLGWDVPGRLRAIWQKNHTVLSVYPVPTIKDNLQRAIQSRRGSLAEYHSGQSRMAVGMGQGAINPAVNASER